jgi:hypothetical protein
MRRLAAALGVGASAALVGRVLATLEVPIEVWVVVLLAIGSLAAVTRLRRSVFGQDPPLTGR